MCAYSFQYFLTLRYRFITFRYIFIYIKFVIVYNS